MMYQNINKMFPGIHTQLKNSFAFYSAYHKNFTNRIIHIITIPLIMWTILVWCAYAHLYRFNELRYPSNYLFQINVGIFPIFFYFIIYILLDVIGGLCILILGVYLYLLSNLFITFCPFAWAFAIGIHILSWIAQFWGHYKFEGNRPALLDSLIQAFIMAPLFIILEILFMLGFKRNLKREIDELSQHYYVPTVNRRVAYSPIV